MTIQKSVIALLTDFGWDDHYVASLKGVILSINPNAVIADISHSVRPQNVRDGAFLLREVYPHFPEGTIFVAVVDPGVGSSRRALCVQTSRGFLIGPDNGLLSLALRHENKFEAREIVNERYFLKPVSATFHGRDIFAPVAAHLSKRNIFVSLGPRLKTIQQIPFPAAKKTRNGIVGEIVYLDRFGNAMTNISKEIFGSRVSALSRRVQIHVKSLCLYGICEYFGEGKVNELMAVWNSSGLLELAVPNGSAEEQFRLSITDSVRLEI